VERVQQAQLSQLGQAAPAVLRHPSLWPTAVHQLWVLAAPGWWHRAPFLPLPDPEYLEFRLLTQYGDAHHPIEAQDLIDYLRWCRRYRRAFD
jgi:hypothetical protein